MTSLPNRLLLLTIDGLTWDTINGSAVATRLCAEGARITSLLPLPITGRRTQATQLLTGQNPGHSGAYDVVVERGYAIAPTPVVPHHILRDAIQNAGHSVTATEMALNDMPAYLRTVSPEVRAVLLTSPQDDDVSNLDRLLEAGQAWAGTSGALIVASAYHPATISAFVNLNDGLRELGILESDTNSPATSVAWSETLAYHVGHGQLWLNLEGRAPSGIVSTGEEYDRVVRALAASLPAKLRDPESGEPVVERVYRRDELYVGEALFRAPDLIVVLRPGYAHSIPSANLQCEGTLVRRAPDGACGVEGLHPSTVTGLMIATGAPFAAGQTVAQASLLTVVATLLHTLGIAIPATVQGDVTREVFAPDFLASFAVRRAEADNGLTAEDEADITARLQSLGYLG